MRRLVKQTETGGPSTLTRCARAVAALMGVTTVCASIVLAVATEPAAITLDLMFSITGFCAGFLYASWLYDPRVRTQRFSRGTVGPMGPRGPAGRVGPRGEQGHRSAE